MLFAMFLFIITLPTVALLTNQTNHSFSHFPTLITFIMSKLGKMVRVHRHFGQVERYTNLLFGFFDFFRYINEILSEFLEFVKNDEELIFN